LREKVSVVLNSSLNLLPAPQTFSRYFAENPSYDRRLGYISFSWKLCPAHKSCPKLINVNQKRSLLILDGDEGLGMVMFKRMTLCVTEATPEEVVQAAIKLCSKETEVYVLHVVRLLSDFVRKEVSEKFSWVIDLFKKAGLKSRLEMVESTDIKKAIVSFVKKNSCDVMVIGTLPRKGLLGFFSESISDYIVKNAPCTVILVRKAGQSV